MAAIDVDAMRAALEERHPTWKARTLDGVLDAVAEEHPERVYVIGEGDQLTYAEIVAWSRRIARGLVAAGVGVGDRVALLLPNGPELVAAIFAVSRAGAVGVPLNVRLQPRELAFVLAQSGSVALLTVAAFRDADVIASLDAIAPEWGDGPTGELPCLRTVVFCEAPSTRAGTVALASLERDADAELDAELAARAARASADDGATTFYTSGTTGDPKGVVLTHDMELRSAYGSAYTRAFEDGRRVLFALPLHHVFAYVEGLLAVLWVGGTAIVQAAFDPVQTLDDIERHRANEALFVPTMTLAVVEAARAGSWDLSALHAVMSAAAVCPARLWREVVELLGVDELVTGYGMTETSAATTFTMPHDPIETMVETVGRPKPGGVAGDPALGGLLARYRAIDPETGEEQPAGTPGELIVEGAIVTRGYHEAAGETAEAFDREGRLRSGDLGAIREDGYLVLTGRIKDLYKCGGELVMPEEVERVLTALPEVAQAHVVALPHERMGEVGCAWVVPADGQSPSADALVAHCRTELARFKVPAHVLFCTAAELPLTASGKVRKFVLAERAGAQLRR
ncbi:MAG: Long-chain-fatty-acid--CoA ligase [Conexibacter sp.]|nr:Long-chain-fatty-acid--CoA ligase [Conexibacter sp.]